MNVVRVVNSAFGSNTYIISEISSKSVWLIDIGDMDELLPIISDQKNIAGVFITHSHYDHILGLNGLIDKNPDCMVFCSEKCKPGLFSDRLNFSYYHGYPFEFKGMVEKLLREPDKMEIFNNIYLEVLETPGHSEGSLTYKVGNYLFTGDSFIPGVKVVTKLRGGNKKLSISSIEKIMNNTDEKSIICPGHGEMVNMKVLNGWR